VRRIIIPILVALALSLASVGATLGHVHGITPLSCLDTDNAATSGGNAAQGAPISGLIPRDVGAAPISPPAGGRLHAAPCQ
jgi:hypothetical protein